MFVDWTLQVRSPMCSVRHLDKNQFILRKINNVWKLLHFFLKDYFKMLFQIKNKQTYKVQQTSLKVITIKKKQLTSRDL